MKKLTYIKLILVLFLCHSAFALSTKNIYVDKGLATGNNDGTSWTDAYQDLATAEAAEDGVDLTSLDQINHFHLRNTGTSADSAVTFSGTTTDLTRYIILEVEDKPGDGTYSTSTYHIAGTNNILLTVSDGNVVVDGIRFSQTSSGASNTTGIYTNGISAGDTSLVVRNCYFKGVSIGSSGEGRGIYLTDGDLDNAYIFNNVIEGIINGADADHFGIIVIAGTNTYAWNNTINNCYHGMYRTGSTFAAINCLIFECTDDFWGIITMTYCASDDDHTGDSGTNFVITQTADDYAALITDADGGDYSVTDNSSELYNTGVADPGGANQDDDDIIGTSRPQGASWDISAFEYLSSTAIILNLLQNQ